MAEVEREDIGRMYLGRRDDVADDAPPIAATTTAATTAIVTAVAAVASAALTAALSLTGLPAIHATVTDSVDVFNYHFHERMVRAHSRCMRTSTAECRPNTPLISLATIC